MTDAVFDVRPDQYPMVIREMIHHENDVTNHRIMWLLVGEEFIANAYVAVKTEGGYTQAMLNAVGVLVALSAFVMLYRSYMARGYLQFLGKQAKQGILQERHLPLTGWPIIRIEGWQKDVWVSLWFRQTSDLFEPWLVMPFLFTAMWMTALLRARTMLSMPLVLMLGVILSARCGD